jgi:hypothetical protein
MLGLSLNFCLQKQPFRYLLYACSPADILTVTNMYCKLIDILNLKFLCFLHIIAKIDGFSFCFLAFLIIQPVLISSCD